MEVYWPPLPWTAAAHPLPSETGKYFSFYICDSYKTYTVGGGVSFPTCKPVDTQRYQHVAPLSENIKVKG